MCLCVLLLQLTNACHRYQGCYVDPKGRCKPLATAKHDAKDVDFRNATSSTNATKPMLSQPPVYFSSQATQYCAESDPVCQKCKRTVFRSVIEFDVTDGLSNFCYGHNDCVCVAVCEAPIRSELLGGLMCNGMPLSGQSGSSNQASSQANRSGLNMNANMPWLVGVPLVGAIVAVMVVARRRRQQPRTSHLPRDVSLFGDHRLSSISGMSDSSESVSSSGSSSLSSIDEEALPADSDRRQLRLDGWRALRNELIVREQQLIAGRQDFSSIGYVQLLDTSSASVSAASVSEDGRESDADDHHGLEAPGAGDAQTLAERGAEGAYDGDDSDDDDDDDDEEEDANHDAVGTISMRRGRPASRDDGHSGDVSML